MAKPTLRHPQFFHTLVPGFHTHLVIPVDFFSKYIQGKNVEDTAELKSDSSDITWKVKMTGPRLSDGWEEFAVGNNLQIGDVLLVRYEGDLVFHVSDLGPNCSETRDITPPSNKSVVQDVIGKILLKKRLYPRTQVDFSSNDDDDEDVSDTELPRKKKLKKNSPEAVSSSSSLDNSSFVANVTATSLRTDTLYLPEYFTSSNGLTRKCSKIVLIDGGGSSWALDLSFNNSSDTFYISRGWRNFCDENGQEAGGFFMFKLVGSGETPVLSFCPTVSLSDRKKRSCSEASGRESLATEVGSEEENIIEDECNSMESLVEIESSEDECSSMETDKTKNSPKRRVFSYSSCRKEFITFTLPPDFVKIIKLSLPMQFTRENGIDKPGKIYLVGKGGKKCLTTLLWNKRGGMSLGKGWKDFVKANGLKTSFTLKLLWKDTTPVLCLCDAKSTIDREQEEFVFIDSSNIDKIIDSSEIQLVTLTITPRSLVKCRLSLPKSFTKENDISKPGMITLLGKDGVKQQTKLLFEKARGGMALGNGWKSFVKENGLKMGDSFTLELIWEDTSPVLRLCPAEHSIDKRGECSETNQKKSLPREPSICKRISKEESKPMERGRDSTPSSQKQVVTLTSTKSLSDRKRKGCSEASRRESLATEVSCEEENIEVESSEDECSSMESLMEIEKTEHYPRQRVSSYSSYSPCQKRIVTFTLPPDYVRIRKLSLPAEFAKENSINKPGTIYLVDKDGTKWLTNLQQDKKGTMSLGKGWKDFVKANGKSFTLKLIWEDTTPLLSLCDAESTIDREQEDFSKPNEKESLFIYSSSRDKINRDENNKEESMSWERNKNDLRGQDSTPPSQKQFVTLTITPSSFTKCRLTLPAQFVRENSMNKPGMMYLVGKDGTKWPTSLRGDTKGTMGLGSGWREFGEAHGLKVGESFTMELIWEDATHMLRWAHTESSSSKVNKKESVSRESRGRDSSSAIQNQFVMLAPTPEDISACQLYLPSQFLKANGINKLGKITMLGENGMEWSGYLLSKDGLVALGNGWDEFCEANGVKLGESFTLEFINAQDKTSPVLKLCSPETKKHKIVE